MFSSALAPLLLEFYRHFSQPTYQRFLLLMASAVLTVGRRTVSNLLRTAGRLARGHPSSYHRLLSKRRWSLWPLSRALSTFILRRYFPSGPVPVVVDDTVDEHRGKRVYAKACHRDAVRSTRSYTAYRWGHKWVALCILVKFPLAWRPWALPVLVALYRSKESNQEHGRRHKTPPELARGLLAVLMRWFPEKRFVLAGDGGFSTHDLASFAFRHCRQAVLVGRFYPSANLYDQPPQRKRGQNGRPRKKGHKLPSPQAVVKHSARQRLHVRWYGGATRLVEVVSGTGCWYKAGRGLVHVRWVFVHDLEGTHRDEYFFSTDATMTPKEVVEAFMGRWSIEVTFQEVRAYLGLETTRGWTKNTVLRAAPGLFGLYSVVALAWDALPARQAHKGSIKWSGKRAATFSDAITAVRRQLWQQWVFQRGGHAAAFAKLPRHFRQLLLFGLAPAA
jgi:hypothetical protein